MKTWGEMDNNDIEKPNILVERPSASRWGKRILTQTFQFVLEAWYIRNQCKNDSLGEPLKQKRKSYVNK
jgi:hypothetical protein